MEKEWVMHGTAFCSGERTLSEARMGRLMKFSIWRIFTSRS